MHYLDTSVLAAYYCPEPRSSAVQRILSALRGPTITPLVELELCCAVSRKARGGDLDVPAARAILTLFQKHIAEPRFQFVTIRVEEYERAREWVERMASPLRALDAVHLAVAFAHDLRLVTSDSHLATSARHFGVKFRFIP